MTDQEINSLFSNLLSINDNLIRKLKNQENEINELKNLKISNSSEEQLLRLYYKIINTFKYNSDYFLNSDNVIARLKRKYPNIKN